VFIMADDLGYGDLGFTGRKDYTTPRLDQLARAGVQLTQSYSAAPVCTPTRVALMTGRYPARNQAGLYEPLTTNPTGLAAQPATLGRLMKNAGYETALVGKWHLGLLPEYHPLKHGFDEFFGFAGAAADYVSHLDTEALDHHFYDGADKVRVEGYLTDLFSARAVNVIEKERSQPFFLNLQFNAPHWPWQAPGDAIYPDSMRWTRGGSPEVFARMVQSLDEGVGRVLDALNRRGLDQNTLVVFTSDNGGERFSHMGPFSNGKMTLYEGGIRVATVARWNGRINPGTSTDQVSITMDWMATLLALAQVQPDPNAPLDGIDLMPALTGAAPLDRDLYWRIFQRRKQKAMRSGNWKYLQTDTGEFLFDLKTDPGESQDRSVQERDRFLALKAKYTTWEGHVLPPIPLDPRYG
jgi:arylsulfatase A-like enzyme